MAAPKGNQYGVGYGRPRTVCPENDDLVKLGKEMIQWVTENDPVHLSAWWRATLGLSYGTWKTLISKESFLPYYNMALGKVSQKYIDGTVPPAVASRFIRGYFKEVKEEENEELEFKSNLKKKEIQSFVSAKDAIDEIMNKSKSPIKH